MTTIEQSLDIDVPVHVAYGQWTQFEEFPRFMTNVKEVRQLDDTRLRWTADVAGKERSWEAKITEQEPNRRISWRAIDGDQPAGTVTFEPTNGGEQTHVALTMEYEPEGLMEKVGSALQIDEIEVRADLQRFKELVEKRRFPSGEWEGRIERGRVTEPNDSDV